MDYGGLASLSSFFVPGAVIPEIGRANVPRLRVRGQGAEALMYPGLGGHVTHWRPKREGPVLWVSHRSQFQPDKPVRGGRPVVFPVFGLSPELGLPLHGLARTRPWEVAATYANSDCRTVVEMALGSNEITRAMWPYEFELGHIVTVGKRLESELCVTNTGTTSFTFDMVLHDYYAISDIRRIKIVGLEGLPYVSHVGGGSVSCLQGAEAISFDGETDRLYDRGTHNSGDICIIDPDRGRKVRISLTNCGSVGIWNPWKAKAEAMLDFGNEEWRRMVCVEPGNAKSNAVTLRPGQTHVMKLVVSVEALQF